MELTYHVHHPEQFWAELDDIAHCDSYADLYSLDRALKSYISFARLYFDEYLCSDSDLEHLAHHLLSSTLFQDHPDRMSLLLHNIMLKTSDPYIIYLAFYLIFTRATTHHHVYRTLRELCFVSSNGGSNTSLNEHQPATSLVSFLIHTTDQYADVTDSRVTGKIGEQATRMLYEIMRLSRLEHWELQLITPAFVERLFDIVESTRDHSDEAFNYSVIRLIIALNEQYMVSELKKPQRKQHSMKGDGDHQQDYNNNTVDNHDETNLVLNVIKKRARMCRTFGENIIFILNRLDGSQEDLCVALLILKLLYLLFTTPATQEYFYTNDLCVLVDVFLRELSDLPADSEGLRNTYLRVLHPLLTNTQLRTHPYKRGSIRLSLVNLIQDPHKIRNVSSTTRRLVNRNLNSDWCVEFEREMNLTKMKIDEHSNNNDDQKQQHLPLPKQNNTVHLCTPSTRIDIPKRVKSSEDVVSRVKSSQDDVSNAVNNNVRSNNEVQQQENLVSKVSQCSISSHQPKPSVRRDSDDPLSSTCSSLSSTGEEITTQSLSKPQQKRRPPPKPPSKASKVASINRTAKSAPSTPPPPSYAYPYPSQENDQQQEQPSSYSSSTSAFPNSYDQQQQPQPQHQRLSGEKERERIRAVSCHHAAAVNQTKRRPPPPRPSR